MKLDVNTMETFYEMAHEGAGLAADRLTPMTDLQTRVSVTRLHFTSQAAIANELDTSRKKIAVGVSLVGDVEGRSLIFFDEESANDIAQMLVADASESEREWLAKSAIAEVGAIMNNGFVDGWADVLETEIDVSPPEFLAGVSPETFVDDPTDDDLAVAFRSRIETVEGDIQVQHYLIPEHETVVRLLAGEDDGRVIDSEKLSGFDRMAKNGAAKMSENIAQMTTIDTEVEVWRIEFISLAAIPESISTERLISVAFTFDGMVSGYLLFLFDRDTAVSLVEPMLGAESIGDREGQEQHSSGSRAAPDDITRIEDSGQQPEPSGSGDIDKSFALVDQSESHSDSDDIEGPRPSGSQKSEISGDITERSSVSNQKPEASGDNRPQAGDLGALERDAIQELSNVMASGFLDGWANVLETTIDHSTPAYTYDMGAAVVDPLVVGLSDRQEFAFVFDVRIRAADTTFHLDVYAIPEEDDLIHALEALDTGRIDKSLITPEFAPVDAAPSSFAVEGLIELDHS